jgi:hypothetical protein
MSREKVVIVGAGVSGLTCAIELEKRGYEPVLIDQNKKVGGRLQTECIDGFTLDRGFQVLLTAYPAVKQYLDIDKLDLHYFSPGAAIFKNKGISLFGDPLREGAFFMPLLKFPYASIMDKFRIWRLSMHLKNQSIESIFERPSYTTLKYLNRKGFSKQVIDSFFKPFYTGIFLEEGLQTSSRMFEFVFKMFAEGYASLPADGIGAVASQLKQQLKSTNIILGSKVLEINADSLSLEDGSQVEFDKLVLATNMDIGGADGSDSWNSCWNLYYETENVQLDPALIGLNASGAGMVNNFSFIKSDSGAPGISVTVVKDFTESTDALAALIEEELWTVYGINTKRLLKVYEIPYALPKHDSCTNLASDSAYKKSDKLFVCGDSYSNSSLNAAMLSGAKVASMI